MKGKSAILEEMGWYKPEVEAIAKEENLSLKDADTALLGKITRIATDNNITFGEAVWEYGNRLHIRVYREFHIQEIMKEKGVSREVAEAEAAIL